MYLMFRDAPLRKYTESGVKNWMIIMLICYLIYMLIELILLYLGGSWFGASAGNSTKGYQVRNRQVNVRQKAANQDAEEINI